MTWLSSKTKIPTSNTQFQNIIEGLVFNCPACTEKKEKVGVNDKGKPQYKRTYHPVSARGKSFRKKGVERHLLVTLLAQIRRKIINSGYYELIKDDRLIDFVVSNNIKSSKLSDVNFEIAVFQKRNDMSDTEAFYYYIRNSFAHGSFEVKSTKTGNVYLLESSKDGIIKAQMRLKEETLNECIRLANLDPSDIKALQKHRTI